MRAAILLCTSLLLGFPAGAAGAPAADPIVGKHLDKLKLKYEIDGDGDYKVVMELEDGRTQMAFVRSTTEVFGSNRVREIWSIGYRGATEVIPEKIANRLLQHSSSVKMGGWVKQKKAATFVVQVPAAASAQELLDAIEATVISADLIEKELTGDKDEF